ncbi:IS21 family transposase [Nitrosomonas sp.]|uniref:IS21 family transposase n=1 Tax=Nitrosomonas sp. TaxID=42353 RepID=UPI0025FC37EE|nr:IS21 family transposase [Nitrosomonas sp.]
MKSRQTGHTQETSAAKSGISIRSGRRIEKHEKPVKAQHNWRTRCDPFSTVWETELVPLLVREPGLTGTTLWEFLEDRYPGQYPEKHLRTLQRRVKHWRATQGPAKEVMFRQSVPAGFQGISDFTRPRTTITIAGEPFDHLLYQFCLIYSHWRCVHIVQGGESYSALADGLQTALHKLDGAPAEHRTDSLSAAYVNTAGKRELMQSYEALCQHYNMRPTVNNLGVSHENGAIETAHGSLKHRIEQAIKVRGSADFPAIEAYRRFLDKIVDKLNKRCKGRMVEEQAQLKPLPRYRFMDFSELTVKVTTSSTISVKRGLYSVHSRLIGEKLRIHLYHDRVECFAGQTRVITLPRVYPKTPEGRARRIDYRHVIHALAAKPQAFRFSRLRDDLLPTSRYRQLWQRAEQQFDPQQACKWMVSVLRFAYDYDCESQLATELLQKERLPELKALQKRFLRHHRPQPVIAPRQHAADTYDQLLNGNWVTQEAVYV